MVSFCTILLLIGLLYLYNSLLEMRSSRFIGNINNPDISSQLIYYKTSNRQSIFEDNYKFVFASNHDTTLLGILLDDDQKRHLSLFDCCYNDGALFVLETPLKGFSAYLSDVERLEHLYSLVSDYIYIPNSLYTLRLSPIELNSNIINTYKKYKGVPKRFIYLWEWYYTKYACQYMEFSSVLHTKQILESWGRNCLLYSNDDYPGIELLYKPDGFSPETDHIPQYPVILLSYENENKTLLFKEDEHRIYVAESEYTFDVPYCLVRYNDGYLLCVKEDLKLSIPSQKSLN